LNGRKDRKTRHQLDLAYSVEFVVELNEEEGQREAKALTKNRSSAQGRELFR